jgi:hypothetical protein
MEFILVIGIWLALGALHVPIYKYWWTDKVGWTVEESRLAWGSVVLGPIVLIASILLVVFGHVLRGGNR